jgi:hypothetical protein
MRQKGAGAAPFELTQGWWVAAHRTDCASLSCHPCASSQHAGALAAPSPHRKPRSFPVLADVERGFRTP